MNSESKVQFDSDGFRLSGTLLAPASLSNPSPAVVISHGWSGAVNERVLPLGRRLSDGGCVVLAIDHRGFGESEGVRARCDPSEQVRDLSNALSYLASLDLVDSGRLGVVGVSFGGAIAVAAGAADERVKATISIVGIGDCGRWLRSLQSPERWMELERRMEAGSGTGTESSRVDFSLLMPLPQSEAVEAELAIMRGKYPGGYPLENVRLAADFRPEDVVDRISPRAVCFITCADDAVVAPRESERMYELAGDPKVLEVFPEGNHGGPLGPLVEDTARVARTFLDQYLGSGA